MSPRAAALPLRVAVLASGRGSNLQALLNAQQAGLLNAHLVGVFSDRPDCGAVALAGEHGIPVFTAKPADYPSREAFDESMFTRIAAVQPDLIVCAGYMRLISERAVQRFQDRMINIHPSLLPKYPGLHTHIRALANGDREHGASVHCVIPALDAGPVLAQAQVEVMPGDSGEDLARRVLGREHPLLVQCVKAFADGTLSVVGGQPHWRGAPLNSPLRLNEMDQLEECT
jgi:phosphoribosylglycinamide formyltransferase-1